MKTLDTKLLNKFLQLCGERLTGHWLLVGGTLLPAIGLNIRTTIDIDIVGLTPKERVQNLELMKIAEYLELSVESINQAASYFVDKLKHSKQDIIILHKGASATVYRPSLEFYWRLKLPRLSESDLVDCQHYFNYCKGQNDTIHLMELKKITKDQAKRYTSISHKKRILKLLETIC